MGIITQHTLEGNRFHSGMKKKAKQLFGKKERTNKKTDPSPSPATNAVHPRAGDV
jgi:hypothetical protein